MAFGSYAILRDKCNYTDVPVSVHWTSKINSGESGVINIDSGSMTSNAASRCSAWYKDALPPVDFDMYATLGGIVFGRAGYLYGRLREQGTSGPDGYIVSCGGEGDGTHIRIARLDNGTETGIADSGAMGFANGDKVGIRCLGRAIEAWWYRNAGGWTRVASAMDGTYASPGYVGLGMQGSSSAVSFIDFSMGGALIPIAWTPFAYTELDLDPNIDAATIYLDLTVASADVAAISDAATVYLALQPISTVESLGHTDTATVYMDISVLGGECYSRFHFTGEGEAETRWAADAETRWLADSETRWAMSISIQPGCH